MRTVRYAPARPRRRTASYWVTRGKQFGKIGKWTGIVFAACMAVIVVATFAAITSAIVIEVIAALFGPIR